MAALAVRRIAVSVRRKADGTLHLGFVLEARLADLRLPDPGPPRQGHDLWRHTCFEAFVAVDGAPAYHELNLSPSGEWAVFAFRHYRDGGPLDDETLAPRVTVQSTAERLTLDALVHLDRLSPAYATATLRLALTAVIEDAAGALSYWSLQHPPGKPDFHHDAAFALRVEPPARAC